MGAALAARGFGATETAGIATLGAALNAELSAHPDGLGGWELLDADAKKTVKTTRLRLAGLRESLTDKYMRRPEREQLADFGRGETVRESAPSVLLGIRRFLQGAQKWPAMVAGAHITQADLDALKTAQAALEKMPAQKTGSAGERTAGKDSRDEAAMAVRLCLDDLRSAARKAFALDDDADARFRGIVTLMPRAVDRRVKPVEPVA